jgi:hypothetical protein
VRAAFRARVALRLREYILRNAEVCWMGPTSVVSYRADALSSGVRRDGSEGPSRAIPVVRSEPVATVEHGDFEWDDAKAAAMIAAGFSSAARVLVVVHATRAERIRLISARRATLPEERLYAERRER